MELATICDIRSGMALRERIADRRDGGVLAIQQGDISPRGEFDRRGAVRIAAPNRSSHLVAPGELVFRSRGPFWCAWVSKPGDDPVVAVAPLFILRPTTDVDPGYLAWYLRQPAAQRYFTEHARGTGVKLISKQALQALPVTLFSLERQRAISEAARLGELERALVLRLGELRERLLSAALDQTPLHLADAPEHDRIFHG